MWLEVWRCSSCDALGNGDRVAEDMVAQAPKKLPGTIYEKREIKVRDKKNGYLELLDEESRGNLATLEI